MRDFDIVVAQDSRGGIGKDGALPWKLPGDMAFFKDLTTAVSSQSMRNAVIMGRKTWESLPKKFRPLPGRLNVVLTRSSLLKDPTDGVLTASTLNDALELSDRVDIEKVFVIGGGNVFEEALHHPCCREIHLTQIDADFQCDVFFNLSDCYVQASVKPACEDNGVAYRFAVYRRAQ